MEKAKKLSPENLERETEGPSPEEQKPEEQKPEEPQVFAIPEFELERIEELRMEFKAFEQSFNARMHEQLVMLAKRNKVGADFNVVYSSDFKSIIVSKA